MRVCLLAPARAPAAATADWRNVGRRNEATPVSTALEVTLLSGLGIGAVYALVGLTYSFIFRTTGTFNFAQGVLVTVGSLFAYTLYMKAKIPAVPALILTAIILAAIGLLNERLAIRPLARRSDGGNTWLIATMGFGLIVSGVAQRIWGTQPLGVNNFLPFQTVRIGHAQISSAYLLAFLVMIAAYVAVEVFQRFTTWGLIMKAVAQNSAAVELAGVNVIALGAVTFAIGGAITGIAGFVIAPVTYAVTTTDFTISILAFGALAIGGFLNHWGALIGGLLVGVVQSLAATYVGGQYQNLIILGLLLMVLLIRPNGLLSSRERIV
jgi:branched-chain amino acid transport system permease protein